jgi:hypothetical protein
VAVATQNNTCPVVTGDELAVTAALNVTAVPAATGLPGDIVTTVVEAATDPRATDPLDTTNKSNKIDRFTLSILARSSTFDCSRRALRA